MHPILLLSLISAQTPAQSPAARLSRPIEYYNPDWSPDGRSIVFESTLSGKYAIYSINADGSGLRRLTTDTSNNEQPRWSPDGGRIVFSSDRAGHLDLYLMNADGSGQTRLTTTTGGGYYQSSFSPDGNWIAFQGRPDNRETRDRVYVIGADGAGLRQITDSSYGAEGPRWAPDGRTIRFLQVPYPKRLWNEMAPPDMAVARAGERLMTVLPDGARLAPLPNVRKGDSGPVWTRDGAKGFFTSSRDGMEAVYEVRPDGSAVGRVADKAVVADPNPSPDGSRFVYEKSVDGWAGIHVYDIAARTERLVTGGPGAGPLGYLRTTTLTPGSDTLDTYTSLRSGGPVERGNGTFYVHARRQIGGRRWELTDTWIDSTGQVTARQSVRTARGSFATELESVRATTDSATLLFSPDRITGWVVPARGAPSLLDGPPQGERYAGAIVMAAIAKARPTVGQVFVAPAGSLFGTAPLVPRIDSIRVLRRDTLYRGATPLPVVVLERNGGSTWVDEATGAVVASRGNAGPERWWWHIRRGVSPPSPK